MKIKIINLFLLFAFVLIQANLANATNYSRSGSFPPVKLTYDDLRMLLQRIHASLPSPETQSDNQYQTNKLTISDGKLQVDIDITDDWEIKEIGRFPKVVFDLSYEFYRPKSKISTIEVRFTDSSRTVSVKGTDPDKVDSAYDSLAGMINEHTYWVGGLSFRIIGGISLNIVALVCVSLVVLRTWLKIALSNRCANILSLLGFMIVVSIYSLPFARWFPGFVIYAGPLSFAERYAPQITFLGLPLAIIALILGVIPIFRARRSSSRSEDGKSEQAQLSHKQTDAADKQ